MNETESSQIRDWIDRTVVGSDGDKVGKVLDIYLDDDTDQPEWLAVTTGLFGTKVSFVPVEGARAVGENVVVPFPKSRVTGSPHADPDGSLSPAEEQALYAHYGRTYTTAAASAPSPDVPSAAPVPSGGDATMVRSEEELVVGTRQVEAGRVKLRKWVETDNVQVVVPVKRQMARVVHETVEGNAAGSANRAFVDDEEEIVLFEETVDVNKRVVAKERVGLDVVTETRDVVVDEDVRKERVELDGTTITSEGDRS